MRMTHLCILAALCIGCTPRQRGDTTGNSPPAALGADRAIEKLQAFEVIAAEFSKLPTPKEYYYASKSKDEEERLLVNVRERSARIQGMVAVFRIMSFDPAEHPATAKQIADVYERTFVGDHYGEPYVVLIQQITEAVRPILKFVAQ